MLKKPAQRALLDALLAWLAACAAITMFLPPLVQTTMASVPRAIVAGLVIALALPLHWIFLGIAARRLDRSVRGWVGLSVLLFPVGGAAALILLAGLLAEPEGRTAAVR